MKIVQVVVVGDAVATTISSSPANSSQKAYFDPTKYTGVQAIYFQGTGCWPVSSSSFYLELYDFTNNQIIVTLGPFDNSTPTLAISSDIKNYLLALSSPAVLGTRIRLASGFSGTSFYPSIIILQNDLSTGRASETKFRLADVVSGSSQYVLSASPTLIYPQIENFDGELTAKFSAFISAQPGMKAFVRLYDYTVGLPVAGSEVYTTNVDNTFVESGPITLVSGHAYYPQARTDKHDSLAYAYAPTISIFASNFTKLVSVCAYLGGQVNHLNADWATVGAVNKIMSDEISASDKLEFHILSRSHRYIVSGVLTGIHLYDITGGAVVSGTEHTFTPTNSNPYIFDDVFTPASGNPDVTERVKYGPALTVDYAFVLCVMSEAFPSPDALFPDPTMPTGFCAFMSQFMKNIKAGFRPLLTPDGVNRTW